MFHPVGQPQKLLFPQQYSPVPMAALDHGLAHLAPPCSRCLPMASIIVFTASWVMAPSSQTEVMGGGCVCILFSMELSTAPHLCWILLWNPLNGRVLGYNEPSIADFAKKLYFHGSGLSPPLLLHASYTLPILNHLEIA